jgi:urea transporter
MNPEHPVRRECEACASGFCAALASTFFASGPMAALGALAALCLAPHFAACALLGLMAAWIAGRLCGFSRERMGDGEWLRGALLTALAAAWIAAYWQWTPIKWVMAAAAAGVLGGVVSAAADYLFGRATSLPALSIGFVCAASVIWMIFGGDVLANPAVLQGSVMTGEPSWIPSRLAAFARSFGAVFFLPHAVAGLMIMIALGIRSRLALLAAIAGWAGGMVADETLRFLAPWLPVAGNYIYNSTLSGLAIAGCFFIPSWRSLLLSVAAGALAIIIWHAASAMCSYGSPLRLFPVPFLLSTWAILAAMRMRRLPAGIVPSDNPSARPEDSLQTRRERLLRDPGEGLPALRPPFGGERVVTQGEDGPHTHRGLWQHALDFEIRDASGSPAPPGAHAIDDYYTYRSPVISPASGWVVRVEDEVDDNPPGYHNIENNWGNFVILRTEAGLHIMLAHFLRHGLAVMPGQYVSAGAFLGSCGNSGRSPLPHLHLHCQNSAQTGAPTVPFRLAPWVEHLAGERRWHASGMPPANTRISAFISDPWATRLFQSWRNGGARYRIEPPSGMSRIVTLETDFTDDGRWSFRVPGESATCYGSVESGALCLRGCRTRKQGLLSWMCIALARVPFTRDLGLHWSETLPSPHASPWHGALFPPRVITTRSRVTALRGGADRLESITLSVEWTARRSAGTVEVELCLFRGLTRLVATTPAGTWRITRHDPIETPSHKTT